MPSLPELPALAFLAGVVLISLSGVMMPGPVFAVTLAKGRSSASAGAWVAVGHGLVEFPLMIAIAAGFEAVFADDAVAFYIGLVGGAMLLFMGASMLRNARGEVLQSNSRGDSSAIGGGGGEESVEDHEEVDTPDPVKGIDLPMGPTAAGVVTTLSNPYFFLWWATVGLLLISEASEFGFIVLGAMMVAHWLCDLGWDWFVSGVTFRSRSVWTPSVHRGVFTLCGLILLGFGLWFGMGAVLSGP